MNCFMLASQKSLRKLTSDVNSKLHSTSAISNARYIELSLSQTFILVPSALLVTFLLITFVSRTLLSRTFTMLNKFFGPFSSVIPLFRTFSSPRLIFKENSSKILRFDRMFIFLCSFIIIRTFFYTTETRCLSSESLM